MEGIFIVGIVTVYAIVDNLSFFFFNGMKCVFSPVSLYKGGFIYLLIFPFFVLFHIIYSNINYWFKIKKMYSNKLIRPLSNAIDLQLHVNYIFIASGHII